MSISDFRCGRRNRTLSECRVDANVKCFKCHKKGHMQSACPRSRQNDANHDGRSESEVACWSCGNFHTEPDECMDYCDLCSTIHKRHEECIEFCIYCGTDHRPSEASDECRNVGDSALDVSASIEHLWHVQMQIPARMNTALGVLFIMCILFIG